MTITITQNALILLGFFALTGFVILICYLFNMGDNK
tara:strand:- start:29 stop:136 length:108 start_codon:yes stop_codon:yes gene_type:complete